MRDILQDIRYAWRQLRHAPGFTTIAVLTLGLGIGANTAFFALANAIAFTAIPALQIDGVYAIDQSDQRRSPWPGVSYAAFRELEAHPPESVGVVAGSRPPASVTIQLPGRAQRCFAQQISGAYARAFGLTPQVGRWITPEEDGQVAVASVVISDRLWRGWFGAKPDIVGSASLKINLKSFTIVGVAPKGFIGASPDWIGIDVWFPLGEGSLFRRDMPAAQRDALIVGTFVRPRPGIPPARLETEIGTALAAMTAPGASSHPSVRPVSRDRSPGVATGGLVLIGISGLVLVAACANLANLLLARGTRRMGETAVRLSLGASSGRILRLFLTETVIIGLLAAAAGLAIALGTMALVDRIAPGFGALSSASIDFSPNYRVFLYAFVVAAAAAMIVGASTAWRASRGMPLQLLASAGAPSGLTAKSGRLRTSLVAVQVAVALFFLMAAGLVWEQYKKDRDRFGPPSSQRFDVDRVATARIDLSLLHYNETQSRSFFDRTLERLAAIPGVEHAAVSDGMVTSGYTNLTPEAPPGGRVGSPRLTRAWYARTSGGFLDTIGVRLLRGRDFAAFDTASTTRVAMISESAEADLMSGGSAIGKKVQFGPWDWLTIVGVFADPVASADRGPTRPANVMFIPFAQWHQPDAMFVVRSSTPEAMLDPIRTAIREVDEDAAVFAVSTLREELRGRQGRNTAINVLMISQTALALAIALLGVYGVIAYFVSTRTREFGVRLALGATPARITKLVIDHAIHVMLIGLLPGVLIVSLSSRLIQSRTFDLMPNDIPTWFVAPSLLLAAGVLAGYLPARRAARVDPNVALRNL